MYFTTITGVIQFDEISRMNNCGSASVRVISGMSARREKA